MLRRPTKVGLLASATAGLLVLLWSDPAVCLQYKPKLGETLSHIALIHYGNADKYIYITMTNQISDPNSLSHERILWIPTVWRYRIRRGDELIKVAKRFLKRSDRAEFIMWFNNISDPRTLKVGMLIKIPFLIRHRVQEGQNMVDLSRRYYFQTKMTPMLRRFNHKRTNVLRPGEIVFVPIIDPEAATEKVQKRLGRYREREIQEARLARDRAMRMANANVSQRDQETQVIEEPDTEESSPSAPVEDSAPDASIDPDPADASNSQLTDPQEESVDASVAVDSLDGSVSAEAQEPQVAQDPQEAGAVQVAAASGEPTELAANELPPADTAVDKAWKQPSGATKARLTSAQDAELLNESTQRYQQGDYQLAHGGLMRFLQRPVSKKDECKARELLAYCLIALDRPKEAEHEFVRLLMIKPRFRLDPVTTSPKIIDVFQRARGKP